MQADHSLQKTTSLVREHIPKDLAGIVIGYFRSVKRQWKRIAKAGEYETCMTSSQLFVRDCLHGACKGGHVEMIKALVARGTGHWSTGLYEVSRHGMRDLFDFMISHGANANYGLDGACRGGHLEIAKEMISLGADRWDSGFNEACSGGHRELAELMISKGTTDYSFGLDRACNAGQIEIIELMKSLGVDYCEACSSPVDEHL